MIPNDLTPGGEAELSEKIKLQLIKQQPNALVIAKTQQKKYPVITYHTYGQGHILVITIPLRFTSGAEMITQLLLKAVTLFSRDIYTNSDLTRLLPIEISLKNQSPEEKTATLKTLLPYGVETFDYKPEPEEGEELKWKLTIPPTSTAAVFFWLKLPDKIDTYEIKTELYEEETKRDEISNSFDVMHTVLFRINELIDELGLIEARGKDAQLLRKTKHHLEKIRNRPGNSLITDLLNLHDAVQAASHLGNIKNIDVSMLRAKVLDIMVVMGRRFYEAVKTWGETHLGPILNLNGES